jgi:hypothetical protein
MRNHAIALSLLVVAVIGTGCDSGKTLGPANQLEVTNSADNFQAQATALDNVSQTLTYTWPMSGTVANVDQSGTVTGGDGTLTVLDDAGTQVYTKSLAQTGSFQTSAGTAGAWTIQIELHGMSGVLNVRVQKQ